MVWLMSKAFHGSSISPWVRQWLRSSFWDRFFLVPTSPWSWACWGVGGFLLAATGSDTAGLILIMPHGFWALDGIVDGLSTGGEIRELMGRDDVALATRAEYIGGHTELPHGRFAYITLRGTRQNPMLTITFPANQTAPELFDIPILDMGRSKEQEDDDESIAGSVLATLTEKAGSGFFSKDKVQLHIKYQGPGGRKNEVELGSFFHGNDEIRNWRNYLICAQGEADTGVTPHEPWKSLEEDPLPETEEVGVSHDPSGNGSKVQPTRRAFERR